MLYSRIAVVLSLLLAPGAVRGDVVTDWNTRLLDVIRATSTNPPRASRAMAMLHAAMYDAVNGSSGRLYVPYEVPGAAQPFAAPRAAGAAAAHRMMVHLFPTFSASFDAALASDLAGIPPLPRMRGVAWGQQCADAIIALRADDGSSTVVPYVPGEGPGVWIPTPPSFAPALLPNWPLVTPWAMSSGDQFRQAGPPPLTSDDYVAAFEEVKELGRVDSATRTPEQTEIALFWADGAGTATPPGHWQLIAQNLSAAHQLTLLDNARLFAMLSFALADAAISSWDNKYAFNHWRPYTAIIAADTDGNDATEADPTWSPLIVTPPFPAYTSGHSTFSGAGSKMLEIFFGTDAISFSTTSDGTPGIARSFMSLSEAAEEAGQSRIYGGIHWQYDNQDGLASGRSIAEQVASTGFGLLGDLDHDGEVDLADLLILLSQFGPCGGCEADLNGDGVINLRDQTMLVLRFTH